MKDLSKFHEFLSKFKESLFIEFKDIGVVQEQIYDLMDIIFDMISKGGVLDSNGLFSRTGIIGRSSLKTYDFLKLVESSQSLKANPEIVEVFTKLMCFFDILNLIGFDIYRTEYLSSDRSRCELTPFFKIFLPSKFISYRSF